MSRKTSTQGTAARPAPARALGRGEDERWAALDDDFPFVARVLVATWVSSVVAGAALIGLLQR